MIYKSHIRLKSIIKAIDRKIGAKIVNLASGIKILCDGYSNATASEYTPIGINGVQIESVNRLTAMLDSANKKTGYNDSTLTDAVQRLVDGYAADAPIYSFGAISDVHIQYNTGVADFQRALTYLRDRVSFTCICGDLVEYATEENMIEYKACVDAYAGGMPLYECAGNHETYPSLGVGGTLDTALWTNTTGKQPCYSFEYNGDVFIFLSLKSENKNSLFVDGGLEWLQQTLEANRNKRCFVWQHVQDPADTCADPSHRYSNILDGTHGAEFLRLIRHYKNVVWFHGHTHLSFTEEHYPVGDSLGYRSVHIPSLVSPRLYDEVSDSLKDYYYNENNVQIWTAIWSEGYIVDVYPNRIVLRGINFAAGENRDDVKPFASEIYTIDTILQTVDANTYV